jgi:hypothetical protein
VRKISFLSIAFFVLAAGCAFSPSERVARLAHDKSAPLTILDFTPWGPNSADGISIQVAFINPSKDTYKYVNIYFTARNRVGDTVLSKIGGKRIAGTESIGPIPYGGYSNGRYGPLWYNSSINCVVIERVEIVYMDNSRKSFEKEELNKLLPQERTMRCMV